MHRWIYRQTDRQTNKRDARKEQEEEPKYMLLCKRKN